MNGKASGATLLSTMIVLPIIGPSTFELFTSWIAFVA